MCPASLSGDPSNSFLEWKMLDSTGKLDPLLLAPEQIEARSFEIISGLLPGIDQTRPEWHVLRRIVHATGDPDIAPAVKFHPTAIEAGVRALCSGCPIIVDVAMVAAGINRRLAGQLGCEVLCAIADPAVVAMARDQGLTRGAAAMRFLSPRIQGAVVAIGNAPTALFSLLETMEGGLEPPALVVGTPVGFVGATESKLELVKRGETGLSYLTIEGTRGGSAAAVAAVNALLRLAVERE